MKFILTPGQLRFSDFRLLLDESTTIELHPDCLAGIYASEKIITNIISEGKTAYGVNTGFGALASTNINSEDLETLQRSIVLSHAAGVLHYIRGLK